METKEIKDSMEKVAQDVTTKIKSTLSVEEVQKKFEEMVSAIKEKEVRLREIVSSLEKTHNTLRDEIKSRREEETQTRQNVGNLKNKKNALEGEIKINEQKIENLKSEQDKLGTLAHRTKEVLVDMKEKIEEFSEAIKI